MVAWSITALLRQPYERPTVSLTLLFVGWKLVLSAIALATPGPGYDTSTQLLLHHGYGLLNASPAPSLNGPSAVTGLRAWSLAGLIERLVEKLTRWDAIYFVSDGIRGRVYEQEWAWWGWTTLLQRVGRRACLLSSGPASFVDGMLLALTSV